MTPATDALLEELKNDPNMDDGAPWHGIAFDTMLEHARQLEQARNIFQQEAAVLRLRVAELEQQLLDARETLKFIGKSLDQALGHE